MRRLVTVMLTNLLGRGGQFMWVKGDARIAATAVMVRSEEVASVV